MAKGEEIQLPADWTEPERWAWGEIRAGRIADFNKRYGATLDPKTPEGWDDSRRLGSAFLTTILFKDPFNSAIPFQGVRIAGAWFPDEINLSHGRINHQLWLVRARFESQVSFRRMKIGGLFSLEGSTFKHAVTMNSLQVVGGLFMRGGASFKKKVDLLGAKVGGQLSMIGATFSCEVNMDSLEVAQALFLHSDERYGKTAIKGDLVLQNATVGGQLAMAGSGFEGAVVMERLSVDGHLLMGGATFAKEVNLTFATIASNLDLSAQRLASVDLTGTTIGGELRLGWAGAPAIEWSDGGRLVLRNAHVGALQDWWDRDAWDKDRTIVGWPAALNLNGFTYDRLGGIGGGEAEIMDRPDEWYVRWLARNPSYSPQPYEQLAKVFRAAGHGPKANAVLYAGRERERREAWKREEYLKWFGLSLLQWTIGYGLGVRYFRVLWWVLGFTLFGAVVLLLAGQGPSDLVYYSFDLLLPLVKLHEPHYSGVVLTGFPKYYFGFHQLVGYVLGSFLIAGLAGLTQR